MDAIEIELNGERIVERAASPTTTLLAWIRQRGLTGTKEGCAEGDCGACTVAILEEQGQRRFRAVNACLVLLPMVHQKKIWTVEGLETAGQLHPVQEALVHELGSQCGYCTPGVVMSMFEACYRQDLSEPHQLDDQMCGNLCRCTGYRPIRDAARAIAGQRPSDRFSAILAGPPEAKALSEAIAPAGGFIPPITGPDASLSYAAGGQRFFLPRTEAELVELLGSQPQARIVAGGTDLALEVTKRFEAPPLLISLDAIAELAGCADRGDQLFIGATTRLSDLEAYARDALPALERMLRYFGSRQIKHRATVGGNLVNASPIGDLPPVFLAHGATVHTLSPAGRRSIDIDDFFVGYRKTALRPQEIVTGVSIHKRQGPGVLATAYKVSKRQELDISAVAASFVVELDAAQVVRSARLAYGGMAATPARARGAEQCLIGRPWSEALIQEASAAVALDFSPISDHRGSSAYRRLVAQNLLRGFYLETALDPEPRHGPRPTGTLRPEVIR